MTGLDPILLDRARGTIPSCDPVLLSFAATLAQRYDWTAADMLKFLMAPWRYQREWATWLRETRESVEEAVAEGGRG